jgi:hypothetical protein
MYKLSDNIDYSGRFEKMVNDDSFVRAIDGVRYFIYTYKYSCMEFFIVLN